MEDSWDFRSPHPWHVEMIAQRLLFFHGSLYFKRSRIVCSLLYFPIGLISFLAFSMDHVQIPLEVSLLKRGERVGLPPLTEREVGRIEVFWREGRPHTAASLMLPTVPSFWDSDLETLETRLLQSRMKAASKYCLFPSMQMHLRPHFGSTAAKGIVIFTL